MRTVLIRALGAALLAGCTALAVAQDDPARAIAQAEQDLAMAQEKDAVWMALDDATGGAAVNLPTLLEAAKKAQQDGDAAEAQRVAEKVSAFAKLGIAQADSQPDPRPVFPQ